jgi:hypothetical protein
MSEYIHIVSGFFASYAESEDVSSRLAGLGLPRERMHIFKNGPGIPDSAAEATSNTVLKDILVDGAVGTAVGASLGIVAEVALVAANVTLFVASPLIAPLVMLGWGASLGGFIGAAAGASTGGEAKERRFADLVRDALANGLIVLLVETRTEPETMLARDVIKASVGDEKDVKVA